MQLCESTKPQFGKLNKHVRKPPQIMTNTQSVLKNRLKLKKLTCQSFKKNYTMYGTYKTEAEAEAAAIAYVNFNGPIEFNGMNCNDYLDDNETECDGWDGEDRRCNCGNRRVYWCISKNLNGTFGASAEAY